MIKKYESYLFAHFLSFLFLYSQIVYANESKNSLPTFVEVFSESLETLPEALLEKAMPATKVRTQILKSQEFSVFCSKRLPLSSRDKRSPVSPLSRNSTRICTML